MTMHHLLLVDEVSGVVDEFHERVQAVGPVVEHITRVFQGAEAHDSGRPVNLSLHALAHNHRAQELFRLLQTFNVLSISNFQNKEAC